MSVIILIVAFLVGFIAPSPVRAEALFGTGYIGMTQSELRAKLGPPHKVRTRMAAQRVYTYHPLAEWDNVLRDQMSSASGEDVYQFVRDRVDVRYSFHYVEERVPNSDTPELTEDCPPPCQRTGQGRVRVGIGLSFIQLGRLSSAN